MSENELISVREGLRNPRGLVARLARQPGSYARGFVRQPRQMLCYLVFCFEAQEYWRLAVRKSEAQPKPLASYNADHPRVLKRCPFSSRRSLWNRI
jgi:hypothetical protein